MAEFSTIDTTQDNIPIAVALPQENALNLTQPQSILSGNMAGVQQAGNFIIQNPVDKSKIGFGAIPGSTTGEYGFFVINSSGNLIMKIVNGTWYVYDLTNNKNVMQSGKLPDQTFGWAVATTGKNVTDGF